MLTKKKTANKKGFVRSVHLQAILFLVIYTILSKYIFVRSVVSPNLIIVFLVPYLYGVIGGSIFLYLFSHEDFFHFVKEIESFEKKKEKSYLKKYLHYGKVISILIIATIGGPIFAALTIRFLLNKIWYKYLLLAAGNLSSTFLAVALAKGFLSFVKI